MPAEFITSDLIHVGYGEAEEGLRRFVGDVIRRLDSDADPRAIRLREDWTAIMDAEPEELAFCRGAGRLGLDPYRSDAWEPSLVELLESGFNGEIDQPLVTDLLEATNLSGRDDVGAVARAWKWVVQVRESFDLRESPIGQALPLDTGRPASTGYRLAERVRRSMGHSTTGPLVRVADAAEALGLRALGFIPRNHQPRRDVKAAVGWMKGAEPVIVGPTPREENRRFLEARGLYHAAFACRTGSRLITDAHTWDQQVSRAFAAELLAPQVELVARVEGRAEDDNPESLLQQLADEYNVSTRVIEHQLSNAGVRFEDAA